MWTKHTQKIGAYTEIFFKSTILHSDYVEIAKTESYR